MTSLRRRLGRVFMVLAIGLPSQWFIADRMIVHVGESEMATRLQHDADSLASLVAVGPDRKVGIDLARVGLIYGRPGSGHYFVVRTPHSVSWSPSFGDEPPFQVSAGAAESVTRIDGPFGQPLLVLARRLQPDEAQSAAAELAVGEDLSALRRQLLQFRLLFLAASALILVAAMTIQGREIRRALQSVAQARDAILRLPQGLAPVATPDAPEEIRPLLDEINRLMRHVEQRLQQSRTAIGNLSHALKTPLAGLLRLAEDARISANPSWERARREQIVASRRRHERGNKRARIAGDRRSGPGFEPRAELPALVELLTLIHRDKKLDIDWSAPEGVLPFDAEDMLEVLGNLADNACKWAASRVHIEIDATDGLCIAVADDGPGCPADLLESLGTRGLRAGQAHPGHGLGLAIVRDIAEAAGGTLQLRASAALGGLEALVWLPR
jgi:signal transduction histidine kinase